MLQVLERVPIIGLDVETTSLDYPDHELVGIGIATDDYGSWYIPVGHVVPQPQLDLNLVIKKLSSILTNPLKTVVAHNIKFESKVFHKYGVSIKARLGDSFIVSWLIDEDAVHKLKSLAKQYLGMNMLTFEDVAPYGAAQASISALGNYCRMDAKACLKLYHTLMPDIIDQNLERALRLEMDLIPVIVAMEMNGVYVDLEHLKTIGAKVAVKVAEAEQSAVSAAGVSFNVGSSQQVGEILFKKMKLQPTKKTKTGANSTDEKALKLLLKEHPDNETIKYILEYRKFNKIKTTYVESISDKAKDGVVYATFKQLGADTGRFSSTDPNLQNIPRMGEEDEFKIRNIFYAPDGYMLIVADYNQIELRVLAHFSKDENMLKAFRSGKDIHKSTASFMFGVPISKVTKQQRFEAKALNFGLVYGMRPYGLASRIGKQDDIPYAEALYNKYFEVYCAIPPWSKRIIEYAKTYGFVRTLIGRKRRISGLDDVEDNIRKAAERRAINTAVQGSAADLIKGAMIKIYNNPELARLNLRTLIQVHDELVFLCPEDNVDKAMSIIQENMEHPFKKDLIVPINIEMDSARYWGDAK
jgi:DNA polymerase-1